MLCSNVYVGTAEIGPWAAISSARIIGSTVGSWKQWKRQNARKKKIQKRVKKHISGIIIEKSEVTTMKENNKIREALEKNGITMSEFARAEEIPLRTFHNWCYGERKPAPYLERWCIEKIEEYAKKRDCV